MPLPRRSPFVALLLSAALLTPTLAQTPPAPTETQADLLARLTPDQTSHFNSAGKFFNSGDYAAALPQFRQLLTDVPNDPILTKYTAEAALNTGDTTYALSLITPLLQANPNDWQAHTLRARIAAQTSDPATRDAEIARIAALRQDGIIPPVIRQYPLERVKVGDRSLLIFQSLFPWAPTRSTTTPSSSTPPANSTSASPPKAATSTRSSSPKNTLLKPPAGTAFSPTTATATREPTPEASTSKRT